jgi:hypothetical protein
MKPAAQQSTAHVLRAYELSYATRRLRQLKTPKHAARIDLGAAPPTANLRPYPTETLPPRIMLSVARDLVCQLQAFAAAQVLNARFLVALAHHDPDHEREGFHQASARSDSDKSC